VNKTKIAVIVPACLIGAVLVWLVLLQARVPVSADRSALQYDILPKWVGSWNSRDIDGVINLHHTDSDVRRGLAKRNSRKNIEKSFTQTVETFGSIGKFEVRKYIARKKRFVVVISYSEKGRVPGTFQVATEKNGDWKIMDFNIDGQGEPELTQ